MEATLGLLVGNESSTHTAARCTAYKPPLRARGTARLEAAGRAVASHFFFFFLLPNWSADSATAADPDGSLSFGSGAAHTDDAAALFCASSAAYHTQVHY
jgi:hypothetical protein